LTLSPSTLSFRGRAFSPSHSHSQGGPQETSPFRRFFPLRTGRDNVQFFLRIGPLEGLALTFFSPNFESIRPPCGLAQGPHLRLLFFFGFCFCSGVEACNRFHKEELGLLSNTKVFLELYGRDLYGSDFNLAFFFLSEPPVRRHAQALRPAV